MDGREKQLTPWSNDAVTDRPGEAFYVHDDDTGALWALLPCPSAMKLVATSPARERIRPVGHGKRDFTRSPAIRAARRSDQDLASRIQKTSSRTRHLSVTAYAESVLGPSRSVSAPFVREGN